MKINVSILLFLLCSLTAAQSGYEIRTDEKSGKPMLVGSISRAELQNTEFNEWWNEEYNNYEVDVIGADQLIPFMEEVKIKIISATWCSDSREQIPGLYKILDYLAFPESDVDLVFVDRDKKGIADETDGLSIDFVPTIIFYKHDSEAGRIVELPYESLELDMLSILYEPLD